MGDIKRSHLSTMLVLLVVVAIMLALPGSAPSAALPSSVSSNKALIQQFYDLFNARQWDSLSDVFSSDVVNHDPAPHEAAGLDGYTQTLEAITAAFPDMSITVENLVVEGSNVADQVQVQGTNKAAFYGLSATGKAVSFETMSLWHVSAGQVDEMWHSDGGIVQQLMFLLGQSATSQSAKTPGEITTPGPTQVAKASPASSGKQTPKEITFDSCPPQGDGGDPVLNENKNRVDEGNYQPTDFSSILNLPVPQDTVKTAHADWSASSAAQVAQYEGNPVQVEGYLAGARKEGPETPNCHSTIDEDFHVWLLGQSGGMSDRASAVVVEMTPRVRANHPGWTVKTLTAIASAGSKVRISGWLMLDPEHPEQLQNTRGTLWEVHPIMQVEVNSGGQWVKLDDYQP